MLTTSVKLTGVRAGFLRTIELSFSDGSSRFVDVGPLLCGAGICRDRRR
jgi:hypothetical protein